MVRIIHIGPQIPKLDRSVCCIGYFDGMHKGHQKLIDQTVKDAKERNCLASLICFSPDPVEVITKKRSQHLFTDEDRYEIAASFGIDQILIIHFDETFMNLLPEDFIDSYLEQMNIEKLICGFDFSYGRNGKGDPALLKERCSFDVDVIKEEKYYGSKISSTRIKEAVISGNFSLAGKLLGFPYHFTLKLKNAVRTGDKYLCEYINADERCIMPKDGIYEDLFEVKDGSYHLVRTYEPSYDEKVIIEALK